MEYVNTLLRKWIEYTRHLKRAFYPHAQEVPFKEGLLSGQLLTTRIDQLNAYPSVSKTLP